MPSVPTQSKCQYLGCGNPRSKLNTYCLAHGGKDTPTYKNKERRKAGDRAYNSHTWELIRARQLSTAPLCAACALDGIVEAASHVDHLFAWQSVGAEAFTRNIFQSLCPNHHSIKTTLERHGMYRHYAPSGAVDYVLMDYVRVLGEQ